MNGWVERVKERMNDLKITREILAQQMGVTYGAITHYLTGRRIPPLGQFHKLAEILQTDSAWLHYGKDIEPRQTTHPIPIFTFVEAAKLTNEMNIVKSETREFLPQFNSSCVHWYALRVQGDAMSAPLGNMKTFIEGNIIVVDSQKKIAHGDFVIALLPEANEVTFKQYVVDSGIAYLKPLNPQYPMIKLGNARLCGAVVWCLNQFV